MTPARKSFDIVRACGGVGAQRAQRDRPTPLHGFGDGGDGRQNAAALQPFDGVVFVVDGDVQEIVRGSQYAAERYREILAADGFVRSMGRRGNPYDSAKAESLMKTIKVGAV